MRKAGLGGASRFKVTGGVNSLRTSGFSRGSGRGSAGGAAGSSGG